MFYIGLHYLKALAEKKGIDIGDTHVDIRNSVNPRGHNTKMPITNNAWREYKALFDYSKTARYEGFTDFKTYNELKEGDYNKCLVHLANFKKYIEGKGVACDAPTIVK